MIIAPINATTYGGKLNLDDVEIGDILSAYFRPHVKIKRFAGQCDLALSYPTTTQNLVAFDQQNNKLIYGVDANLAIEIYPKESDAELIEGAIELDVVLKKRPAGNKNTITIKVETSTIDFQKIVGLDAEYDQARCIEDFPKHTPPFVITPTSITDATGEVLKTRAESQVNSYQGRAKQGLKETSVLGKHPENGRDITYTSLSRTAAHIRRGKARDAVGTEVWVEDMNLVGSDLTFTLPLNFIKNAVYPIRQAVGVDPAYTQEWQNWNGTGTDGVWANYDLYTNMGVPKGAVAEIIIANIQAGTENLTGIRTDGSSLDRYIDIHEAEAGGQTHCRMFVVCHATTGLIEVYGEDITDAIFYVAGYWENIEFTELFDKQQTPGTSGWNDLILTSSASANKVCHIIIGTPSASQDTYVYAGVRTNGSSIDRYLRLHESESGGISVTDMFVKPDANYTIESYKEVSITPSDIYNMGYFGEGMDYVEKWEIKSGLWGSSSGWTDWTLTTDQAGRAADITALNFEATYTLEMGMYGTPSTTRGTLIEHEAEDSGGEFTGFSLSCINNASYQIKVWVVTGRQYYYIHTGYFKPGGAPVVTGSASGAGVGAATSLTLLYALAQTAGSGVGLASLGSLLHVLGQVSGNGVGSASAAGSAFATIEGSAPGSGTGEAALSALTYVIASSTASGAGEATAASLVEILGAALSSGVGAASLSSLLEVLGQAEAQGAGSATAAGDAFAPVQIIEGLASGSGEGLAVTSNTLVILINLGAGQGIGGSISAAELIALALASGEGIGSGSAIGGVLGIIEGSALGSGEGLGAASAGLIILAQSAGSGIGSSQSGNYFLVISGLAPGSGVGVATIQAIVNILAGADGSGIGLGSTAALITVLSAAAASGEGLGEAEALLEAVIEAIGQGIGSAAAIGYVNMPLIEGSGQGSGIGEGASDAILEIIAQLIGSGIGQATVYAESLTKVPQIYARKGYHLGVSQERYTLGDPQVQDKYTLSRERK